MPTPLDYHDPRQAHGSLPRWAQRLLGGLAFFAAVALAIFLHFLPYHLSPHRRIHLHPWNISGVTAPDKFLMDILGLIGPTLVLVAVVWIIWYGLRHRRWRAFAGGILMALAGMLLLIGVLVALAISR